MPELVRFTYRLPDDTERDVVVVDDDGAIRRRDLDPPTGPGPELGWWEGHLDDEELGSLRLVTDAGPPPDRGVLPTLPAAGVWWVTWSEGAIPLVTSAEGGDADAWDALVGQFSAMLSVCAEAATVPMQVLRLQASVPDATNGYPLLTVIALGAPIEVTISKDGPDDDASFVTPDLDTLGYVGTAITVPTDTLAHALLSRVLAPTDELVLSGLMTAPDGGHEPFEVAVEPKA